MSRLVAFNVAGAGGTTEVVASVVVTTVTMVETVPAVGVVTLAKPNHKMLEAGFSPTIWRCPPKIDG